VRKDDFAKLSFTEKMLEDLNELVRSGAFPSRSEAIRVAIRDLINRRKVTIVVN
jgi:Ribbon-helix-helix protein, copG family.